MSLTVSICVIAYNEENTISGILSDILYQTYPHKLTQIVLVNSRSEDNTQKIMEQFANSNSKNYISIDILENNKRSQASGWNTALKKAIGDVIIRVDAHASIPKDFIEKNEKDNKINKESELKLKLKVLDSFFLENNLEE